jgi:branched-chain amino acid transport system permease protein
MIMSAGERHAGFLTLGVGIRFVIVTIIVIRTTARPRKSLHIDPRGRMAADSMGSADLYKVVAFAIGAFFAGIAGGLYAHNFYIIQPSNFGFLKSFDILILVVLGGLGSLSGAVLAAILLTVVTTFLQDYPETRMIIYSLVLIVMMSIATRFNGTKK